MWDSDKALLREKFIELSACIRREGIFEINDFSFYLKILEKEEQIKFKVSRRVNKKLRTEINNIKHTHENRKKSMKQKADSLRRWAKLINV